MALPNYNIDYQLRIFYQHTNLLTFTKPTPNSTGVLLVCLYKLVISSGGPFFNHQNLAAISRKLRVYFFCNEVHKWMQGFKKFIKCVEEKLSPPGFFFRRTAF